eukprot:6189393-Lingulodinium_polyedra.AAC.1
MAVGGGDSKSKERFSWADAAWEGGASGSWEGWAPHSWESDSWEVVPWSPTPEPYWSFGNVWESHPREGEAKRARNVGFLVGTRAAPRRQA